MATHGFYRLHTFGLCCLLLVAALSVCTGAFATTALVEAPIPWEAAIPHGMILALEERCPGYTLVDGASTTIEQGTVNVWLVVMSDGKNNVLCIVEGRGDNFVVAADNPHLLPEGPYQKEKYWLSSLTSPIDGLPTIWLSVPPAEENFYLVFSKRQNREWAVSHAEFDGYDDGEGLAGYTVTHEGTALNVLGNAASVSIIVPNLLDVRLSAFDMAAAESFCRESLQFFPGPPFGPQDSPGVGFPAAQAVSAASPGATYPVYTGPGEDYLRAWGGGETFSTGEPFDVLGQESNWALIRYPEPKHPAFLRYGYVPMDVLPKGMYVPELGWESKEGLLDQGMLDPGYPSASGGEWNPAATLLAASEDGWLYVEVVTGAGQKTRGFVSENLFHALQP